MNEQQNNAKITRDRAVIDLNMARRQLAGAIEMLRVAEEGLQREVDADKDSWYGS